MLNIVVLVSGGGTNLQAIIDACENGTIAKGKVTLVLSSKANAFALKRAKKHGIASKVVERKDYSDNGSYNQALLQELDQAKADVVVLAGFMSILSKAVTQKYAGKIMNVHPSLIPSFCGDGYYGLRVHQAALDYGVKVSGATVHFVNEVTDGGAIILQKAVNVQEGDTPQSLQKRVMEQAEWKILPKAISLYCEGKLKIDKNRVIVKEDE